jgi:3-oxoisoapionate kinase
VSTALYSYYGDDFTGSTDVLEALADAGLRSVLFLGPPSDEHRRRFTDCQAFGIAGDSRSRSPEWMSERLPEIFTRLRSFGAPILHYKTCSTFDSSPQIGSIGRAMEIGREALKTPFVPVVVAAPHLRRYVAFGNLFAAAGDTIHRIDRHPTMRQHPVTPMYEGDLRRHLAPQTRLRVGLIDLPTLQAGRGGTELASQLAAGAEAVVFDGVSEGDLHETGRLLWQSARHQALFAVGSSGLTYSLAPAWKNAGATQDVGGPRKPDAVESLLVMSGSCSPVTERQIGHALRNGYEGIRIKPAEFADARYSDTASEACIAKAIDGLSRSRKVVIYSSLGPLPAGESARGDALGRQIGSMLRTIIGATGVRRVVLAGGDTSSHAVSQLGLYALTWAAATQPGAPLCCAHSDTRELDGLELVLKGGQVGTEDFFERVRTGAAD